MYICVKSTSYNETYMGEMQERERKRENDVINFHSLIVDNARHRQMRIKRIMLIISIIIVVMEIIVIVAPLMLPL